MSERKRPTPEEAYGFTTREEIFDRIGHERFLALIEDVTTTVHQIQVAANNYGEFLFVTTSRELEGERYRLTFWGLGYHEYRERWISQEWFWYHGTPSEKTDQKRMTPEEALEQVKQRQQEIAHFGAENTQSKRGRLFELLADLTDEDGAYTELDDLANRLDDFDL